jgi:hypothetical protein
VCLWLLTVHNVVDAGACTLALPVCYEVLILLAGALLLCLRLLVCASSGLKLVLLSSPNLCAVVAATRGFQS